MPIAIGQSAPAASDLVRAQFMPQLFARGDLQFVITTADVRPHGVDGYLVFLRDGLRCQSVIEIADDLGFAGGKAERLAKVRQARRVIRRRGLQGYEQQIIRSADKAHDPVAITARPGQKQCTSPIVAIFHYLRECLAYAFMDDPQFPVFQRETFVLADKFGHIFAGSNKAAVAPNNQARSSIQPGPAGQAGGMSRK